MLRYVILHKRGPPKPHPCGLVLEALYQEISLKDLGFTSDVKV